MPLLRGTSVFQDWTGVYLFLSPALLLIGLWVRSKTRRLNLNLPPSPAGLPLIGHLHLIPKFRLWVFLHKLAQEFKSPLTCLNLAGQDIVVVNEYNAAVDILEKRSATYSSRPRLVVSGDYGSSGKRIILLPYGDAWRNQRAAFHHYFRAQKAASFIPIQSAETKLLMRNLLQKPTSFMQNFTIFSSSIVLRICYGIDSDTDFKKATHEFERVLEMFGESTVAGAYLVDAFPWLDRLPDFLSPWRATAIRQRDFTRDVYVHHARQAYEKVAHGQSQYEHTFSAQLWLNRAKFRMDEVDVAYLAGNTVEAGADTTATTLSSFVLAVVAYPHTFAEAQAEVDKFCQGSPTMEDIDRLPYVMAMCKEIMRWRPAVPNGLPHLATTTEDDDYNGMRIPAGAMILPSLYAMGLSQEMYGQKYDSEIFEPRRWTDRPMGVGDFFQENPGFGFGRRVCPGKYLAMQSLFLAVSNLCYYFDINPKEGATIDIHGYTTGLTMQPEPFECNITARPGKEAEIESEAVAARELLASMSQ